MMQWSVLTIGRLSRNCFWGEREDAAYREAQCTSTLIQTGRRNIVVDPSLPGDEMAECLFNASGLRPDDIDIVYITHKHPDHYVGIEAFPKAAKYMAAGDWEDLRREASEEAREKLRDVQATQGPLCDGVSLQPLPGHTPGLAGLLFEAPEGRVLVSGDCVMTRDFYRARLPYYFCQDADQNKRSIEQIAGLADVVVPGHGNYFIVNAYK